MPWPFACLDAQYAFRAIKWSAALVIDAVDARHPRARFGAQFRTLMV